MPLGMLMSTIVHVLFGAITLLLGYVFYTGKAGFCPSGIFWKESRLDGKKLMRFTGRIMFCLAFCAGLMMIRDLTGIEILYTVAWVLMMLILIVFLIRGNGTHFLKYK